MCDIRCATVDDGLAISKISADELGYDCEPDMVRERLRNIDDSNETVFVATIDRQVVGYVHIARYNTLFWDMANIQGLAVASNHHRQGCGKALMAAAEKWAADKGYSAVRLNSGLERESAHIFYRSIGYDNEKEQIRFIKSM